MGNSCFKCGTTKPAGATPAGAMGGMGGNLAAFGASGDTSATPAGAMGGMGGNFAAFGAGGDTSNDWMCPGCGINVFASKSSCFKCGTVKPGMGGVGGVGAMGGCGIFAGMADKFAAFGKAGDTSNDWLCPGCGINVFASKSSCFKCGTVKPDGATP